MKKRLLLKIYNLMTTIREFEKKLIELHPEQQMRSLQHYYIGQEAIASGIISQLSKYFSFLLFN